MNILVFAIFGLVLMVASKIFMSLPSKSTVITNSFVGGPDTYYDAEGNIVFPDEWEGTEEEYWELEKNGMINCHTAYTIKRN